jgi:predicted outer membrane repeat protein
MTTNRMIRLGLTGVFILVIGLGFVLALPWFANQQGLAAHLDMPAAACYATNDNGANTYTSPGAVALQHAVDTAAPGVTVKVAGTCKGVNTRAGTDQTVYIDKDLTLEGGHTQTDWSKPPDPDTYPTTLDADEKGRVAVIKGNVDVTLEALQFTNGRANDGTLSNNGAGIWTDSSLTLKASNVFGNIADNNGGGFYCDGAGSGNPCNPILKKVIFNDNQAKVWGGAMFNDGKEGESSPELTGVTFTSNSADYGGAMFNYALDGKSNPSLTNATFSGNSAEAKGGAVYNFGVSGVSNPNLTKILFFDNIADESGGAMYNDGCSGESSPTLTSVTFSGNSADLDGGAMLNDGHSSGSSSPTLINVILSGNFAGYYGGAIYNYGYGGESTPTLTNVTFSGNSAGDTGGAIYNRGETGTCSPEVYNSILWNNQDKNGTGTIGATIRNNIATTILSHSLIQASGGSINWKLDNSFVDGGGNIDNNPMFVTPVNPSNAPTTAGNLRLKVGSPAIEAGKNAFITGILTDLDGEDRIIDGNMDGRLIVDMGAYESPAYDYFDLFSPLIFR